jgi:hypothetical protein
MVKTAITNQKETARRIRCEKVSKGRGFFDKQGEGKVKNMMILGALTLCADRCFKSRTKLFSFCEVKA